MGQGYEASIAITELKPIPGAILPLRPALKVLSGGQIKLDKPKFKSAASLKKKRHTIGPPPASTRTDQNLMGVLNGGRVIPRINAVGSKGRKKVTAFG